jgi:uncharacterized membrane protein YbhN (UPF0104 family)
MKSRAQWLTLLSLLVGGVLFVFVIRQTGSRELWQRVSQLDARFLWLLLVSGLRPLVRALAWLHCLPRSERHGVFLHLWRARLIGDAIGNVTTAGPLLAEPSRLVVLSGRLPLTTATASLSLEFLSYFLSACLVMLAGLLVLLTQFALNASLRRASAVSLFLLFLVIALVLLVVWRRWSLVAVLRLVVARLGAWEGFSADFQNKLRQQFGKLRKIERHTFNFARHYPRDFAWVCWCEAGFHLLGVIEIMLTLWLIGASSGWLAAFIFESVNRLINVVFAFVPIKLGVDEAGTALLAQVLGFPSLLGVTLAVYRKLRVLFWTIIGLGLLLFSYARRRNEAH